MKTYLWTPASYGTPTTRVRRNPNASVFMNFPEENPAIDAVIMPNGYLNGPAEDALAQLEAAGPRGAALLGAVAGFVFGNWKTAAFGGVLGYYAGKYLVNFASKALTVVTSVNKIDTAVAKATT